MSGEDRIDVVEAVLEPILEKKVKVSKVSEDG